MTETAEIRLKALPYYACYISRIISINSPVTVEKIRQISYVKDGDFYLLSDEITFSAAIKFLEDAHVVKYLTDEFGPHIIVQHPNFGTNLSTIYSNQPVFEKYSLAGDGRSEWLDQALRNIRNRMQSDSNAFSNEKDGWHPIPLDRSDNNLAEAIEKLDQTIEELRSDNGYAVEYPEEKSFVLDKLTASAKRLREDIQISSMYLEEFAIKPLTILVRRFGRASIGIAAEAARQTIVGWLKARGISFLDDAVK